MSGPDWTYWLQMMNFAMAAVVVLAGLTVCVAIVGELRERRLRHAGELQNLDEEVSALLREEALRTSLPELERTVANVGKKLKHWGRDPDHKTQ
ncbi:MAG TPA: hypothetical protein VFI95_24245 [Terriglobales bacterium]|nr:hypothetical protein [Terriglobales bacterium]